MAKAPKKTFKAIQSVEELLGDNYTGPMRSAFPDVEIPYGAPFGYLVLAQLRQPLTHSASGRIIMPDEKKDAERYRTQAALVRAVGSQAFHDRQNGNPWKEGAWYGPGDFIRVPMFGGDRFDIDLGIGDQRVTFVLIRECDAVAPVVGNPLTIKTS
jgi:hypothetical protein